MATDKQQEKKNWLWPKIDDEATALDAAKAGAVGGGLMIIGLALPIIFFHMSGEHLVYDYETRAGLYISQGLQITVAAFLTWRVWRGKGRFASIVLLIWIITEVSLKLLAGQLNPGWMIMWFFAIFSLVHSVRGHWKLHAIRRSQAAVEA